MRRPVLIALTLLALVGCSPSKGAPKETCVKAGEQCRLDKNVLGVCEYAPKTASCASPPCLVCTGQH